MQPIEAAITGAEDEETVATPYQVPVQFCRPFNRRDLAAIAANWATSSWTIHVERPN